MKMNTQPLLNLEVSLAELIRAFDQLPPNEDGQQHHFAVPFPLTDDYGNVIERQLLFGWNAEQKDWELNAKSCDLLITASERKEGE